MHDQHYARGAMAQYMGILPKVVDWLQRHRITSLVQLTQRDLQVAQDHFPPRQGGWVVGALKRFF
jgi:hypothetical protein